MPTIINHNGPKNGDITSPTAAELWVLTQVREALAPRFDVRELREDKAWSHHEDEELGWPPLGTMVSFSIVLPRLWLRLETWYWHAPGDDTIDLRLRLPEDARRRKNAGGDCLADPQTAQLLSSFGLRVTSTCWFTTWKVRSAQDHAVVAEMVRLIEGLAAIPFPVAD